MYVWPTDALDENDGEYCPLGMICQKYYSDVACCFYELVLR